MNLTKPNFGALKLEDRYICKFLPR